MSDSEERPEHVADVMDPTKMPQEFVGINKRSADDTGGYKENDGETRNLNIYLEQLREAEKAQDKFASEGMEDEFDQAAWAPSQHLEEKYSSYRSPYQKKSYRFDLLKQLDYESLDGETFPSTMRLGVSDLEVLLIDPTSESMDALLLDPEYKDREWFFTEADSVLPKAVLIGSRGQEYPDNVVTNKTLSISKPLIAEERLGAWRKNRKAKPLSEHSGNEGLKSIFGNTFIEGQPSFHKVMKGTNGRSVPAEKMIEAIISPKAQEHFFKIGKGHRVHIGGESKERIKMGRPLLRGMVSPLVYLPNGNSGEQYRLPLTENSAAKLWEKDWEREAKSSFEYLSENDYWLTEEAAAALSAIAISHGSDWALDIAHRLAAFQSIDGTRILKNSHPEEKAVVGTMLRHLEDSTGYNLYE